LKWRLYSGPAVTRTRRGDDLDSDCNLADTLTARYIGTLYVFQELERYTCIQESNESVKGKEKVARAVSDDLFI
jgi:hypothetical protein